jgi:hypothetical protein
MERTSEEEEMERGIGRDVEMPQVGTMFPDTSQTVVFWGVPG